MLPNFGQKVTFGETKITGLKMVGEKGGGEGRRQGEHSGLPAPLASIQKGGRGSVFLISSPVSTAKAP